VPDSRQDCSLKIKSINPGRFFESAKSRPEASPGEKEVILFIGPFYL